MITMIKYKLEKLRRYLLPRDMDELGWQPVFWLGYLGFLFMPAVIDMGTSDWLLGNLLSIPVFLMLYFRGFRHRGDGLWPYLVSMAALGFVLAPIHPNANTYLIYAAIFAPFLRRGLRVTMAFITVMLLVYALESWLLGLNLIGLFVAAFVAVAGGVGNNFYIINTRRQAELRLSHDEVRRLAALAERERIGRDLHDLLGHTLSLVALKSELASRLCERDPHGARREIDEVQRVARDALSQVRLAVTGIRAAGIAAELASARLMLEMDAITMEYDGTDIGMPVEVETVLALVVREAITNVQRHAQATAVSVKFSSDVESIQLTIIDNGRGNNVIAGNGLKGMRERIQALGGTLHIDSKHGRGTKLEASVPMTMQTQPAGVYAPPQRPRMHLA
ncbi:MAG: sensor histidine kinase [Dokdonella sp.]